MKLAFYKAFSFHGGIKSILIDVAVGIFSFGKYRQYSPGVCPGVNKNLTGDSPSLRFSFSEIKLSGSGGSLN